MGIFSVKKNGKIENFLLLICIATSKSKSLRMHQRTPILKRIMGGVGKRHIPADAGSISLTFDPNVCGPGISRNFIMPKVWEQLNSELFELER